tara:strand:+ start:77 stop:271 length:195 start_codon:yes stop_codon:yes gene_type:complete
MPVTETGVEHIEELAEHVESEVTSSFVLQLISEIKGKERSTNKYRGLIFSIIVFIPISNVSELF